MYSKEDVIAEITRQGLPFNTLDPQQQKAIIVSARMKSIYDPLSDAVIKAYKDYHRTLHVLSELDSLKK